LTGLRQASQPASRHIICFGNPLHGDDGFGPAVYERLHRLPLRSGVRLTDAGTAGPAALVLFLDCAEVVIVDALMPAGAPGHVSEPSIDAVCVEASGAGHGIGVGYLLRALAILPEPPPVIKILAAEAATVTPFKPGLSPPVARAVDEVVARLRPFFEADFND
jgi:hydrogenase maturation protease